MNIFYLEFSVLTCKSQYFIFVYVFHEGNTDPCTAVVLQKVAGELQAVQLEKQAVEAQWRDAEREWEGQLTIYQESLARLQGELAAAQEAHHADRDQAQASLQLGLELEKERGRLAGQGAYSIVIEDWGLVALIYRGLGSCSIDI